MPIGMGVVPVIPTPLNDDETLDAPAMRRILQRVLDAGVHGVWVLGSAGEMPDLEPARRRRVLETAVETVNGRSSREGKATRTQRR